MVARIVGDGCFSVMELERALTRPEQEREKGVGNREAEGQKWAGGAIGSRERLEKTWRTPVVPCVP